MTFDEIIQVVNDFVWGPVMLILLVGTGVLLMILLKFRPIRNLGAALKMVFKRSKKDSMDEGDISPFQSLMTALAATIGTGNIAGVSGAMVLGGAGAVFWMWIAAIFGLATKYAESVLAVNYRLKKENGTMAGGPMYAMKYGIKPKWVGLTLGVVFAGLAVVASFGIGNLTQANTVAASVKSTFGVDTWITGIILAVLAFIVIVGGIKSIGRVTEKIVPFMAVLYILGGLACIFANISKVPEGLGLILSEAFSAKAMLGGAGGIMIVQAMRFGVARGVFSNEAGLGSAPIAAAAAKTDHPSRQGYINMTGTFFDTIVVCSITGLVIACSGILGPGNTLTGADLTLAAFGATLGVFGKYVVTVGIILFAFSTILGWSYYGEKCLEFFFDTSDERVLKRRAARELKYKKTHSNLVQRVCGWFAVMLGLLTMASPLAGLASLGGDPSGFFMSPQSIMFYAGFAVLAGGTIVLGIAYRREQGVANIVYRVIFSIMVFVGCTTSLTTVWNFADTMNGLMAIPNLISLIILCRVVMRLTEEFETGFLNPEREERKKRKNRGLKKAAS